MKQTKETSRNTIKTPVQHLKQDNKNRSALKHLWDTLKTSRIPLESFLNHPNMHTNHPKYGHPLPPRMVKLSPIWDSKMCRKLWSPTIYRMFTNHPSVTSTHNLQDIHQPSQVWSPTIPKDGHKNKHSGTLSCFAEKPRDSWWIGKYGMFPSGVVKVLNIDILKQRSC